MFSEMQEFYMTHLGLSPYDSPKKVEPGTFWAATQMRPFFFGETADFMSAAGPMNIVLPDIDTVFSRVQSAGFSPMWENELAYVRRFRVGDPIGNQLLIVGV